MGNRVMAGISPLGGYKRGYSYGDLGGAAERLMHPPGQHDPKDRLALSSAFHGNPTTMILNDFLHNRQSQPRAVLFAIADKRMEQPFANGFRNARTIVGH